MRVLIGGFMGSGKTVVGRALAGALGTEFIDLDERIEAAAGAPIRSLFESRGEAAFRALEREQLTRILARPGPLVLATGGGALLDPRSAALALAECHVFRLSASPAELARRLSGSSERPLLDRPPGEDLEQHIAALAAARESAYRRCGISLSTEGRTPAEVVTLLRAFLGLAPLPVEHGPGRRYQVIAEPAALDKLGSLLRQAWKHGDGILGRGLPLPPGAPVVVIADRRAWKLHGERLEAALRAVDLRPMVRPVAGGERSKSRAMLARIQDFLLERGVERGTPVVAFGGGVIGDLAGFAAATVLRGLPVVQVPTTLLAQVDSSIGGKVAVDHPRGKNLLGAFHPPSLVVADPELLATLPPRERRCGLAEIVKMALLGSPGLFGALEAAGGEPGPELLGRAIRESIALKAEVVRADPEEAGMRRILNLGHTLGHAIERCSESWRASHGEAVAVGLIGALRLGARTGLTPAALDARVGACLRALGLPVTVPNLRPEAIVAALALDKKRSEGRIAWVLLRELGEPAIRSDVRAQDVAAVAADLTGTEEKGAS